MTTADFCATGTDMSVTCPSWCLVEHLMMPADRQRDAERQCAWLDTHPDEVAASLGSARGDVRRRDRGTSLHRSRRPGEPVVVDTYLLRRRR